MYCSWKNTSAALQINCCSPGWFDAQVNLINLNMSSTKLRITKKTYSPRNCSVSTATLKTSSTAWRRLNYLFFNFSKQWSVSTCWILCQLTDKRLKGVHFGCYQLRKGGSLIFTVNAWILLWWFLWYAAGWLYFKTRLIQLNSPFKMITYAFPG